MGQTGDRQSGVLSVGSNAPVAPWKLLFELANTMIRKAIFLEQWCIEVYRFSGENFRPINRIFRIRPPDTAFWADPFLHVEDDQIYLFFEELPFNTNKGHISALVLGKDGRLQHGPRLVLKEAWHLSYPFLWSEGGKLYMIPEASDSREVALYESTDSFFSWRKKCVLLSGVRLADPTIVRYKDKLWMFATTSHENGYLDDCLHIYYSDRLEGPWISHARNPVKIDANSSRPAGNMWVEQNILYRVSQDCSTTYGSRTICTRVLEISEFEFREEIVQGWGGDKCLQTQPWHTYNICSDFAVTDRLLAHPKILARLGRFGRSFAMYSASGK